MVSAGLFNDPLLRDQGILSRVLASLPTSLAGNRPWRDAAAEYIESLAKYKQRMRELVNLPSPLADGTRNVLKTEGIEVFAGRQEPLDRLSRQD